MKKLGVLPGLMLAIGLYANAASTAVVSSGLSLKDVFQGALKKNESISIQESRTKQTSEKLSQAYGTFGPKIGASGTYFRQDTESLNTTSSTSTATMDQTTAKLTLTQPLFHGFKEYAAVSAAQSNHKAQESNLSQSRLSLFSSVAQAYFNVLAMEQDLQNYFLQLDMTLQRLKDLQARARIGRSRKGEVHTVESQVAALRAQVENAKFQKEQAWENLIYVAGVDRKEKLAEAPQVASIKLLPLNDYLSQLNNRPDLVSLREQSSSSEEAVSVARGGHYPQLDLAGNYYLKRPSGTLENSKWDVTLTATLSLFEWGVVQSQVREASAAYAEKVSTYEQNRRNAEKEVRTYFKSVESGLSQVTSLKEALQLAEKNYKEQTVEYRNGLVTNLDVLQSLSQFIEIKRSLDKTLFQTFASKANLDVSSGKVSP